LDFPRQGTPPRADARKPGCEIGQIETPVNPEGIKPSILLAATPAESATTELSIARGSARPVRSRSKGTA
jgi:hypothetical protein